MSVGGSRTCGRSQPVLICSAAILDWHVAELHDLNVDQFLTKPYHPLDLLDRIAWR